MCVRVGCAVAVWGMARSWHDRSVGGRIDHQWALVGRCRTHPPIHVRTYSPKPPHPRTHRFNADPWPAAEAVSPLVGGDKVFLLLYTEMAFQAFFKNKVKVREDLEVLTLFCGFVIVNGVGCVCFGVGVCG